MGREVWEGWGPAGKQSLCLTGCQLCAPLRAFCVIHPAGAPDLQHVGSGTEVADGAREGGF